MLARRATIMGYLNGDYETEDPSPPQITESPALVVTTSPKLARSQSSPALPFHIPYAARSHSSSQQPSTLSHSPSAIHADDPPAQDLALQDDTRSVHSTASAHLNGIPFTQASSQLSYDLYEDEEEEMVPAYSQDYVMQDEEDEDDLTATDGLEYSTLQYGQDDLEYEEEALNGFVQPCTPAYHQPYPQGHDYEDGTHIALHQSLSTHPSDMQVEDEEVEDTTNAQFGLFDTRYEHFGGAYYADDRGQQGNGVSTDQDDASHFPTLGDEDEDRFHSTEEDDRHVMSHYVQDDYALLRLLGRGEAPDQVDEPLDFNQTRYSLPASDISEEGNVPACQPHVPTHLDQDVAEGLDDRIDTSQDYDNSSLPLPSTQRHDPSIEQWRVGKMAGHQGSYKRVRDDQNGEDGPRGTKRTLRGDIEHTVERVLKKPFVTPRPVAKLRNAPVPDLIDLSDGEDDPALSPPSVPKSRSPAPFPLLTPTAKASANKTSARLAKPFKTPARTTPSSTSQDSPSKSSTHTPASTVFDRSFAPSPPNHLGSSTARLVSSTPGSGRIKRSSPSGVILSPAKLSPVQADKTKLANLEARLHQLRDAVNYQSNPEAEDETSTLTERWLIAGRDIAERLFDRYPKPDNVMAAQTRPPDWGMARTGRWMGPGGGDNLTSEQKDFLDTVRRDEDGDPVDDEGNKLVDDGNDGGILSALGESGGRGGASAGPYKPNMMHSGGYSDEQETNADDIEDPDTSAPETQWSIGTMLPYLGVDPKLLGWDPENETWIEGEF